MNRFDKPLNIAVLILCVISVGAVIISFKGYSIIWAGISAVAGLGGLVSVFYGDWYYSKPHLHSSIVKDMWIEQRYDRFDFLKHLPVGSSASDLMSAHEPYVTVLLKSGGTYDLGVLEGAVSGLRVGDHVTVDRKWIRWTNRWFATISSTIPRDRLPASATGAKKPATS